MNVVLVRRDGTLVTPESDSILEGVTRESVLQLAADRGHRVERREIALAEWRDGVAAGDIVGAFACGTAAVIVPIGKLMAPDLEIVHAGARVRGACALAARGAHGHPVRPRRGPLQLDDPPRRLTTSTRSRIEPIAGGQPSLSSPGRPARSGQDSSRATSAGCACRRWRRANRRRRPAPARSALRADAMTVRARYQSIHRRIPLVCAGLRM